MSPTIWIPGAERITPSAPGGVITSTAPPRVVWHTTEATPGPASVWDAMVRVLTQKSAEPNVLYDPITDRLGQFFGLDRSGRALKNDGSSQTNRVGRACIQIEVIGRAAQPFTDTWRPGKNFRAFMAAARSWGIADVWPSGPPPRFIASPPHNVPEDERSRTIWLSKGGHYGHSQIPGNNHGDPGAISISKLFAASGGDQSEELFTVGQYEEIIAEAKRQGDATRAELKLQGDTTRQEVRRQAAWAELFEAQTVDERVKAHQAYTDALAAGKTPEEASLAAATVMQGIIDTLKQRIAENG